MAHRVDATTQVQYGLSANYGNATTLDSRLVKNHVATLTGLAQGTQLLLPRRFSRRGGSNTRRGASSPPPLPSNVSSRSGSPAVDLHDQQPRWIAWKTRTYDDSGWLGQGPGLLYVENSTSVGPKGTALPPPYGTVIPRTYYFRTHFNFTGSSDGLTLTFSNYVDDGAVFYLNGAELYRLRMPAAPTAITYATGATGVPCAGTFQSGDAITTCPDVFALSGTALASLVQGDNVVAVEVHNYGTPSPGDIVFGSALILASPALVSPQLYLQREGDWATLYWNGEGFTLQQSTSLGSPDSWMDVPGPVTQSPLTVASTTTVFYRLRH